MINPQKENGYIAIANEILEQLVKINISNYEFRVLFVIIRKTYGFQKKLDRISLSQFEKATGIKSHNVCRILKRLLKRNLIVKKQHQYGFQKKYNQWILSNQILSNQILSNHTIGSINSDSLVVSKQIDTKERSTKETSTKERSIKDCCLLNNALMKNELQYKYLELEKKQRAGFSWNTLSEIIKEFCYFCKKRDWLCRARWCFEIVSQKLDLVKQSTSNASLYFRHSLKNEISKEEDNRLKIKEKNRI